MTVAILFYQNGELSSFLDNRKIDLKMKLNNLNLTIFSMSDLILTMTHEKWRCQTKS